jgi:hypothetical protein
MKPRTRSVYFSMFICLIPQPAIAASKARQQHLQWVPQAALMGLNRAAVLSPVAAPA